MRTATTGMRKTISNMIAGSRISLDINGGRSGWIVAADDGWLISTVVAGPFEDQGDALDAAMGLSYPWDAAWARMTAFREPGAPPEPEPDPTPRQRRQKDKRRQLSLFQEHTL